MVLQKQTDLQIPFIRKTVFRFAYRHAVILFLILLYACYKQRKEFIELSWNCRRRILFLSFKTHLGSCSHFWNPLFKRVAGRKPQQLYSEIDEQIWDQIIPPGYEALDTVRRHIPAHVGTFIFPIPKLYREDNDF